MFLAKLRAFWLLLRAFVRNKYLYLVVAGGSVIGGIVICAAYATVLDYTSSLHFCADSCHEMHSTVYAEYTHSKHFKNAHGVVVVCADCHVPHHNWPATFATKFMATFELWNHVVDREYELKNFNPRRLILAKRVWAHFAADNAAECKACHKFANMVLEEQNPAARAMHTEAMKRDANCVECHEGITHNIPEEQTALASTTTSTAQDRLVARGQQVYATSCAACHNNMNPKLGDKAAWASRIKQGDAALVSAAIHGVGPMPARGGNPALSDNDIKAAVAYIESKANESASTATAQDKLVARGQQVYTTSCAACHNNMNPKLGDKAAWASRIKQGDAALVSAAIHGAGPMPARGGNPALSDNDIKAAVAYIESKVK